MDIEEMKKYSQNKIEADNLIKQVRQKIKETIWEKQNLREGFTETFKPLISQFEKPDDPKAQNIFTQNQKMLQNQLALTEGIRANQKAITDGFSQFERLADMQELPGVGAIEDGEDDKDDQARAPTPTPILSPKPTTIISPTPTPPNSPTPTSQEKEAPVAQFKVKDFDKYLNNQKSQNLLKENAFDFLPSYYFDKDINELNKILDAVTSDLYGLNEKIKLKVNFFISSEGYHFAESTATKRGPTPETIQQIDTFNTLSIYAKNLSDLSKFKKNKTGSGLFINPQELLHRFELLNGSLVAGNNGVLPEFIQIAHRLRDLGILTNKQLNKLLRKVIQTYYK